MAPRRSPRVSPRVEECGRALTVGPWRSSGRTTYKLISQHVFKVIQPGERARESVRKLDHTTDPCRPTDLANLLCPPPPQLLGFFPLLECLDKLLFHTYPRRSWCKRRPTSRKLGAGAPFASPTHLLGSYENNSFMKKF